MKRKPSRPLQSDLITVCTTLKTHVELELMPQSQLGAGRGDDMYSERRETRLSGDISFLDYIAAPANSC